MSSLDSIGSSLIAAAGGGTGQFDVESIATGLAEADVLAKRMHLDERQEKTDATVSALGKLKSALSTFVTNSGTLQNMDSLLAYQISSSDEKVLAATTSQSASVGIYDVEVTQLAKAHSIYSGSFTALTDSVGTGTLNFQFGTAGTPFVVNPDRSVGSVIISSTNNTLEGVRDAVNGAGIGVRAAVVNDGGGYRLTFSSMTTGAKNSLQLTTVDSDGNDTDTSGLSRLRFDDTVSNMTQSSAGQDASLKVNGLTVSSETNTVSGAIAGVELTLLAADAGKSKTLSISNDTAALKENIQWFVEDINALKNEIGALNAYDTVTGEMGELRGDSLLRGLIRQVDSIIGGVVSNVNGELNSLSSIGITRSRDLSGTLLLDENKLDAALKSNFEDVAKVFAATTVPTDSLVKTASFTDKTKVGEYGVNITQLATKGALIPAAVITDPAAPVVNANNDTFMVRVDGTLSTTITLTQKTYSSSSALAAEIQSKINGDKYLKGAGKSVTVTFDSVANQFTFTSNRYGSTSSVDIVSVESATESANLGLSVATGVVGVDVAGTINGAAASGSGQHLSSDVGDSNGLKVQITGGATGSRGSVKVSRGYMDQLVVALSGYTESKGLISNRESTLNDLVQDYAEQRVALDEKYEEALSGYREKFTLLNALLGDLETQRESMAATFEGMFGNN